MPNDLQTSVQLPRPEPLLGIRGWAIFLAALITVCAVAPALNLLVPEGNALHLSDYLVGLLGKFMCYAIVALAIDLIWGYTGILSLGHGLFFALGGYVMGMYLMREIGRDGNYKMRPAGLHGAFWTGRRCPGHWALSVTVLWPRVLLVISGSGRDRFVYSVTSPSARVSRACISPSSRRRITYAAMLLFFRNETGFGGNNGFTGFKTHSGPFR
jgi:urea transport system permease protein